MIIFKCNKCGRESRYDTVCCIMCGEWLEEIELDNYGEEK